MKTLTAASIVGMIGAALLVDSLAFAKERTTGRGHGGDEPAPVVYVTSQGLYYDSIALGELPQQGDFQQLIPGENGLETEFGPGQVGHLGGRWWIDINGDEEMNEGDMFFLCPLLGPGRETL
ncbi:MAG: hypothetical protein ABFS39_18895 [Pseudomonadota bacterium]